MNRKRICIWLLTLLIFLSFFLTSCSTNEPDIMIPDVKKGVYVYDQGEFIDDQVEKQINNLLVQLEEKTEIEFAVITIPTLNNLTIESYAVKLGNELRIGKEDSDNGILLLISKTDTKVRLEIGKGIQGIITDGNAGEILDDFFVSYRSEDNYDDASINTVQAVINYLAESEEYKSSIDNMYKELEKPVEEDSTRKTIIIIIVIIIILLLIEWLTGKMTGEGFGSGIFLGGYSGSSSGGGFGGGNSFNGGGASR